MPYPIVRSNNARACDLRKTFRLATLIALIASLLACARERDPETAYNHAWDEFQHGDLVHAEQEANNGYRDFHESGSEWAWKFAILKSRILYERGLYGDVLKLLSSESVPPLGEQLIQKYRFEGMALTALHLFPEAERKLSQADQVCAVSDYAPCADVVSARGMLEMARAR